MRSKTEAAPLEKLKDYLPDGTFPFLVYWIKRYHVQLTIKPARKSVLGDYRKPHNGAGHKISVNGNLNPYAFFLTLTHEIAHLLVFEKYGNAVKPHGQQWKQIFIDLMAEMDVLKQFPEDVSMAMTRYMRNPAARSGSDINLVKTLRRYDSNKDNRLTLIEELEEGDKFEVNSGRAFVRGKKLRKRYEGKDLKTGNLYSFSPLYEVKKVL